MTPERLEQIRLNLKTDYAEFNDEEAIADVAIGDGHDLIGYIDVLHEDLRLTRQERDQEKHKNLELRKDNALLHRALEAVEGYVGRLEHERAALRRGQGRAPEPGTPEHPPFHHTHPIPDSTKGEQ